MLRISIEPPDNKSWSKGPDNDLHLGESMKSIQTDVNPTETCYQTHEFTL